MDTPFISKAKAWDTVTSLDNTTADMDRRERAEIVTCMLEVLGDVERVLDAAAEQGQEPREAFRLYVAKVNEYWNGPIEAERRAR